MHDGIVSLGQMADMTLELATGFVSLPTQTRSETETQHKIWPELNGMLGSFLWYKWPVAPPRLFYPASLILSHFLNKIPNQAAVSVFVPLIPANKGDKPTQ
ncbi:hypothetical protein BaRGS_00031417 [Batillaria attramentaria]|uniref:Uncharacterized protein n=1 Tax=Batillaria attramentaria TaxID=370345 RepID=A0ABD0JR05_9CAEN